MRRFAFLLTLVLGGALLVPASAAAHAQLLGTSPQQGAVVKRQPAAVIFKFDQPVEGNFGAVRVYDAKGGRVDQGDAFHPESTGSQLGVHLKPDLPKGSYTATYRVISADGHVVSSGMVFSIGKTGVAPKETVAQLIGNSGSGPVTETVFGLARGIDYAATALVVGGLVFLLLVWLPALAGSAGGGPPAREAAGAFSAAQRKLLTGAALAGALATGAGIVLEGATAAGIPGFSALRTHIVSETLGTRFGTVWGIGVLAWLATAAILFAVMLRRPEPAAGLRLAELGATGNAPVGRRGLWPLSIVAVPLAWILLMPAFAGHADTQSPRVVLFPANVAHVAAMSLWAGGLVALLFLVPVATRRLEPADRGRLLAAVLVRFSPIALAAVAVILVTGLVQAYVYIRHLDSVFSTGFGRAVFIKLCLLFALIGLGAYNRRVSIPALKRIARGGEQPGRAGLLLRRALRAEVALVVVVLGVTAALVSYAPPVVAQSGPFSTTTTIGPAQLEMTVDPARVGANEVHLYLFNPTNGAQYTRAKEIDVQAKLPDKSIGPLNLKAQKSGPGHYTVPRALLSVPGTWQLQITMRISAFDEFNRSVQVAIR